MDDTDPTPASTDTDPRTAASTSSTPTGQSQHADPLLALGEQIVAELGDPRTNNTLARWLSHHTVRLIHEAKTAREADAPDADARDTKAREAILELWQARAAWPGGWPPPRAAEIVRILNELPALDDEGGWYRPTILAHLQDLHYHILAILTDSAVGDGNADIEQGWLDMFGDQLTPDEASLLRRAVARPRRIDSLLRWWNRRSDDQTKAAAGKNDAAEEDTTPTHPLLDLADAYHAAIADLIQPTADDTNEDDTDADELGADASA